MQVSRREFLVLLTASSGVAMSACSSCGHLTDNKTLKQRTSVPTENRIAPRSIDRLTVGIDGAPPWATSILARDTQRTASGRFVRSGERLDDAPDLAALSESRALASEVAALSGDLEVGMGSDSSQGFDPFFVAPSRSWRCSAFDESTIRSAFSSALYAETTITIEALSERTSWWSKVLEDCGTADATYDPEPTLARWRALLAWFARQSSFVETAFIAINLAPLQPLPTDPVSAHYGRLSLEGGCAFPRLLVGRTNGGAMAGLLGVVVYS